MQDNTLDRWKTRFAKAAHPTFNHYLNDPEQTPEADLITDIYLPLKA
jgi:DNA gyrase inhibitor GyrI